MPEMPEMPRRDSALRTGLPKNAFLFQACEEDSKSFREFSTDSPLISKGDLVGKSFH